MRVTGQYRIRRVANEDVLAFVPHPLPPADPPLEWSARRATSHARAIAALERLSTAAALVPSADWFLYGFVRKEAVITSQIEGTQATLKDVLLYETTGKSDRPDDVEEIGNYVDALTWARREIARTDGLPLSIRLLCAAHKRLMRGTRGVDKHPGSIRTSQNWIGGTRPGNAQFVPPPADDVPSALSDLETWIHGNDSLPPLVRAGLAHAQFESIHPFLDGNGRLGRLLIALLVEHWRLATSPLLYVSLAFKRHREEYYRRLSAVRTEGDWEGWIDFFLAAVEEAAADAVATAERLSSLIGEDRRKLLQLPGSTIPTLRLFEELPRRPIVTLATAIKLLKTTKPTAIKALNALQRAKVLRETTGRHRDRLYAYHAYLEILTEDTE